jgi:hypothetical protein
MGGAPPGPPLAPVLVLVLVLPAPLAPAPALAVSDVAAAS